MEQAATDAFFDVETEFRNGRGGPHPDPWGTWVLLLSKPANLVGCAEIHLQRFHGRDGMLSFKAMRTSTEKGEAVSKKSDKAKVDAPRVAQELFGMALEDGRRVGCDTYRVQLKVWSGNGKSPTLIDGAYAGLRIDPVSGNVVWNASGERTPEQKWRELAEFAFDKLQSSQSQQSELTAQAVGTMITAVGAADELASRRIQHAREYEAAALPASPEAVNERWRMGLNALGNTMREVVRFAVWNKTGMDPGPIQPGAAGPDVGADTDADDAKLQGELRDYFAGLSGETHEKLRAKMGQSNFDGLIAILHGDLGNFKRNFPMLGAMLGTAINGNQLAGILTDAQLRELCQIFGVEPPHAGNTA